MSDMTPDLAGLARQREYEAAYQEARRARIANENRLAVLLLCAAGGAGLLGLRWVVRRRQKIAAEAINALGAVEAQRRKAAKAIRGVVDSVNEAADKR